MPAIAGQEAWTQWIDQARAADLLSLANQYGAKLKKTGTVEWAGPCPSCGGNDRFSINVKKQVFNCRGCGGKGNVISFVEMITGGSFIEACERITGTPRPDRTRDETLEERNARLKKNAARLAEIQKREEEERAAEAAKAKHDEEAIDAILERAAPICDAPYGWAYLKGRGLNPHKRLVRDIRFVEALDYYGAKDNGTRSIVRIATLPAIVAVIRDFSGAIIGISQTYLDPQEPRKWRPEGSPTNSPKKIRGDKKGGMIHLGRIGETLALAEGWENALAFHQLGYGPEDMTLAAAVDLGNLSGGATGTVNHPALVDGDDRPLRIKNGVPDKHNPGIILPEGIKSIIIVGDLDSETYSTAAHLRTAVNRFMAMGITVDLAWPDANRDWNDVLISDMGEGEHAVAG
jgi:CHC2 zinc finger